MGLVATPRAMVLSFDGARYVELTAEHDALDTEVSPFGPSPTTGAAFLLGFARAPENGAAAVFPEEIRLHLFRTPAFGGPPVSSDDPVLVPTARLVAEYRNDPKATGWRRLDILEEIGRAHVLTPVTNAHLVCRLLLEQKKNRTT